MLKSAESGGLADEENEPLLAGKDWRLGLAPGALLDCQHHTTCHFRLAIVTDVTPDSAAPGAEIQEGITVGGGDDADGSIDLNRRSSVFLPSMGDSLHIHFLGHPVDHDWVVARGSPFIVHARMLSGDSKQHFRGDATEGSVVADGWVDPVCTCWALEDRSLQHTA